MSLVRLRCRRRHLRALTACPATPHFPGHVFQAYAILKGEYKYDLGRRLVC